MMGVRPIVTAAFQQSLPAIRNSSNYITKSYFTSNDPALAPVTQSCNNNPENSKVLTRAHSADPRLNKRDLTDAPKQKISVEEYHRRNRTRSPITKTGEYLLLL